MKRFATIGFLLCWLVSPAAASPPRGPSDEAVITGAFVESEDPSTSVLALRTAWAKHFDALLIVDPQVSTLTTET